MSLAASAPTECPVSGDWTALPDGTPVRVHAMAPDDADSLVRFHATLSRETTHLRFFSAHPTLSSGELFRFTHVDHLDRDALVATVDDEIVGVARFDRIRNTDEAEVAFVVTDSWQGHGVGSLLLGALIDRAREVGIAKFVAETLPHNRRMQRVFRRSGLPCTWSFEDGVVHVVIDLGGPLAYDDRTVDRSQATA